jgi:probable HAF family extracellular repeat protein
VNQSGAIALTAGELDIQYGKAYRYSNGVYTSLGSLAYGASTRAYGLNNSGVVVGDSGLEMDTWEYNALRHGVIFQNGQVIDLGTLGGAQSTARSINDSNAVVGWSEIVGGNYRAYIYSQGVMTDLGTLGGNYSIAESINNLGDVAGSSKDASGKQWATLWDNGTAQSLGWLGSASDINELGQVVGSGNNNGYLYSHGIAYNLNSLIDPSSGLTITSANGINDLGQIVGQACDSFGDCSAVLLTPVPEPETYGMMLAGLGIIGYAVRRRKQRLL